MQILRNEEIPRGEWIDLVKSSSGGNFFQHPNYYEFTKSLGQDKIFVLGCKSNGVLVGVLQFIVVDTLIPFFSRRTIIYGGPIVCDGRSDVIEFLFDELIKSTKKSIYIEFRNLFETSIYKSCFFKYKFKYEPHNNVLVRIDKKNPLSKINSSKVRQIKKSLNLGCEIREPLNIKEVNDFYLLLKKLYKTKVKKPLPSWKFLKIFT